MPVSGFPPAGLTFAVFLVAGWRALPTIVIACIISTFWENQLFAADRGAMQLLMSGSLFAVLHSLIYGFSAQLLRGTIVRVTSYNLYHLVMRFLLLVAGSSLAMALSGVFILYGGFSLVSFKDTWLAWWIGDMSGVLVLAPIFVALLNRLFPNRSVLAALRADPTLPHARWRYTFKLMISSVALWLITYLANYFQSEEIACFVFFLVLPQMWIVYTENALRTACSLTLFSFLTASLVSWFGMDSHAYLYQFAINVIACSAYFAMAVPALVTNNKQLYEKAHSDYLTKTLSREHFFSVSESLLKQALRQRHAVSLVLFDIDKFKQINDKFGHSTGDLVLQQIATLVQAKLRDSDIVGRFGGDEFMLLLPQTSLQSASEVAEMLRKSIAQLQFSQAQLSVSCSFGVALVEPLQGLQQAFEQADQNLLAAKRAGRNRSLAGTDS